MKKTLKSISLLILLAIGALAIATSSCSDDNCQPELKPDCFCTAQYDPVCGCDGKTYGNACEAMCHSITDVVPGEC